VTRVPSRPGVPKRADLANSYNNHSTAAWMRTPLSKRWWQYSRWRVFLPARSWRARRPAREAILSVIACRTGVSATVLRLCIEHEQLSGPAGLANLGNDLGDSACCAVRVLVPR